MSFYTFRQNNSGGSFSYDREAGISRFVIVEADTEYEAVSTAEDIGLYFDGDGDCSCCGNRWDTWIDGFNAPGVYSDGELTKLPNGAFNYTEGWAWMKEFEGFVHYKDGNIIPVIQTKPGKTPVMPELTVN